MPGVPATPNFSAGAVGVDQQKAALLAALAQGGSAMAQQQASHQQAVGASSGYAAQQAAARAVNPQQAAELAGGAAAQGQYYQGIAARQGGAAESFMSNLSSSHANYMDQVGAAVPLVQAQTQRELNSLQSAASEAAAERALRREMLQLQRDKMAREDTVDPLEAEEAQVDLQIKKANLARLLSGASEDPRDALAALELDQRRTAADKNKRKDDILGRQGPKAAEALSLALSGENVDYAVALQQLDAALGSVKTPKGKGLNKDYLRGVLSEIYGLPQGGGQGGPQKVSGGGVIGRSR